MDNVMMIGLSRQIILRREMDVTANNIANANTSGFKAERVLIEAEPRTPARAQDGPRRLAYVDEWGLGRDFSQGALDPTGRSLDFALEGEGFFTLETPQGGEAFTRDGRFTLSADGELVAQDGARVLNDQGVPILVDPAGGEISADADGTLVQNGLPLGRIGVVRFENPGVLSKAGDNRYTAPEDAAPEPMFDAVVRQGASESSNVRPVAELVRMLEVSRTYSSVTRMLQETDRLSRDAIGRLGRPT